MSRNIAILVLLATIVFVSGCIAQSVVKASLDAPFQLKLGQAALIEPDALKIKFINITEDSRCPSSWSCKVRGEAVLQISISKGTEDMGIYELSDWKNSYWHNSSIVAGDYNIQLTNVEPYRKNEKLLRPSDYIATLIVSKK